MKQSFKIAYGGIMSALSLTAMFATGIFPFAEYALPALAGLFLVALVVEFGYRTGVVAYVAVSFLSLMITPNKEAVVLFIAFLGYYQILKGRLESLKSRIAEWAVKIGWFNFALLLSYYLLIHVMGMTQLLEDAAVVKYGLWFLWVLGNLVFVVYDVALTRVISAFVLTIRPKYLKRLMK